MSGISGGYPGGPPRHGQEDEGPDHDRPEMQKRELRGGESVEASVAGHAARRKKKRRNRRLVIGLVTSLIAAAGVGAYVGLQNRKTAEDLAQQEINERETDLEKEADRLLNELWKMEDLERTRRP